MGQLIVQHSHLCETRGVLGQQVAVRVAGLRNRSGIRGIAAGGCWRGAPPQHPEACGCVAHGIVDLEAERGEKRDIEGEEEKPKGARIE